MASFEMQELDIAVERSCSVRHELAADNASVLVRANYEHSATIESYGGGRNGFSVLSNAQPLADTRPRCVFRHDWPISHAGHICLNVCLVLLSLKQCDISCSQLWVFPRQHGSRVWLILCHFRFDWFGGLDFCLGQYRRP